MLIAGVLVIATLVMYAVSSIGYVIGEFFARKLLVDVATWLAAVGLVLQTAAMTFRWFAVGHGPFLGFFEVAGTKAYFAVATFLLLQWWKRGLRVAGIAVMPAALVILGATQLVSSEAQVLGGALASSWLTIHIVFANFSAGCGLAAFGLAICLLLRESRFGPRLRPVLDKLPSNDELDALCFRLVGAAFVFEAIMIVAGAIWANQAWGTYWGWDPIEVWSLISWGLYALYLHATATLGWKGRKAAILLVVAVLIALFDLLLVPILFDSIHGAYIRT